MARINKLSTSYQQDINQQSTRNRHVAQFEQRHVYHCAWQPRLDVFRRDILRRAHACRGLSLRMQTVISPFPFELFAVECSPLTSVDLISHTSQTRGSLSQLSRHVARASAVRRAQRTPVVFVDISTSSTKSRWKIKLRTPSSVARMRYKQEKFFESCSKLLAARSKLTAIYRDTTETFSIITLLDGRQVSTKKTNPTQEHGRGKFDKRRSVPKGVLRPPTPAPRHPFSSKNTFSHQHWLFC